MQKSATKFRDFPYLFSIGVLVMCQSSVRAQPTITQLRKTDDGQQLLRAGKPFWIRGAGGDGSMEMLAQCGANSLRTWGADSGTEAVLDEAHRLGLAVTVGIWIGQRRQGFDFHNEDSVARQGATAERMIRRFKDHPAVLMWGIGNEMELPPDGTDAEDDPAVWKAVNAIAASAHRIDPHHPTMTVIAEVGGDKVASLHSHCPDIDIVGINSYGGVSSLPTRYRQAGGSKPYVVTEFGPPGTWEVGQNALGVIDEPTSNAKAESYRKSYQAFAADKQLCLGCYAFVWGSKQEATPTWFGMLLPDGKTKTPAVDVMTQLWTGNLPENRCPVIRNLAISKDDELKPGEIIKGTLDAFDPDGDALQVEWQLLEDRGEYITFGERQAPPDAFNQAIVRSDTKSAEVQIPVSGGIYRLFAYVRDGKGGGSVANVPLRVDAPRVTMPPRPGRKVKLPLIVEGEGSRSPFSPSGWMGNHQALEMDQECATKPHTGDTCTEFVYRSADGWAGVVWQDPPDDWGDQPGGYYLVGATKLSFWARGKQGGEKVKFSCGLIDRDKRYYDTAMGSIEVVLTPAWKQYTIDLTNRDLSRIKTGFAWSAAAAGQPFTFYLDDIRFE